MPKNTLKMISPISQEEFLQDFLSLPLLYRGILFALRTGYFIKQAPLDELDVKGLCPATTDEEQEAVKAILYRYFSWKDGYWKNEKYDVLLADLKEQVLAKEKLSKQRAASGKKGAGNRWSSPNGETMTNAINEDGKTITNAINEDDKTMANAINKDGKTMANAINKDGKTMANAINKDGKTMANAINKDGKMMANAISENEIFSNNAIKTNDFYSSQQENPNQPTESFEMDSSRTRTYARADPIPIGSVCINNINNKNNNKIGIGSGSDQEQQIKKLFEREQQAWQIREVLQTLTFFGLDEKILEKWRHRNQENATKILELATHGMAQFDYETFSGVFSRCQQRKDQEGRPLSSAIAFVIKSLQKEILAIQNRKNGQQTPTQSAPKRFADRDYMEGVMVMPDGSYRMAPKDKSSKNPQRDFYDGLIQMSDGSYRLAPKNRSRK